MKVHRNARRRRALLKRTPWLCYLHPLIDLPATWGLDTVAKLKEARCSARS